MSYSLNGGSGVWSGKIHKLGCSTMSHFKGPDFATDLPEYQANTSVLNLLVHSLEKNGDATALVETQTGRTISFKGILQQSTAISVGLRKVGVTAGDYVLVCCDKSIAAYSALLGVMFTGATAVLYPITVTDCVPKMTQGFTIKAVFCDRQYHNTLTKSMSEMTPQPILVAVTEPQDEVFTSLMSTKGNFELYDVKDLKQHIPMILFSSGTTSDPKGIELSNLGLQLFGRYLKAGMKSFFVSSPMFWLSALVTFMSSVLTNVTIISSNSTDPKENLQLLEKYKATVWFIGTGSLPRYINEPTLSTCDLSSLGLVAVGGEVVLSSVVENFKVKVLRGRARLTVGYGSSEAGLLCSIILDPTAGKFQYGLCGKPMTGVDIKITGDDGQVVPVGSLGEICVKSQSVTPGYWGRPDLNQAVFDEDGFFRSGDLGFFNQEGELFLRGRVGDQINYKGTKVSSAEVEDVLMSHPAVLETAVVGRPHPVDIQHITAYVVKKQEHEVTEKELQNYVDGSVADNLRLRGGVYFMDDLPRTIIGKVMRRSLREM